MAKKDNFLVFVIGGLTDSQASKMLNKVSFAKQCIAPAARGVGSIVKREAIGSCLSEGIAQIEKKK